VVVAVVAVVVVIDCIGMVIVVIIVIIVVANVVVFAVSGCVSCRCCYLMMFIGTLLPHSTQDGSCRCTWNTTRILEFMYCSTIITTRR